MPTGLRYTSGVTSVISVARVIGLPTRAQGAQGAQAGGPWAGVISLGIGIKGENINVDDLALPLIYA
jgi:hypothetical protein